MKKMIIFSAVMAPGIAFANPPATGAGATAGNGAGDPNQMICMNVGETGSRLSHTRVCQTRAQWAEQRRLQRQDVEHAQGTNPRN